MPVAFFAQVVVEEELRWLSAPAAWVIFLCLIPACGILAWTLYRFERGDLTPGWRYALAGLRFLLLVLLLAILFEPVLSRVRREERAGHVLVLIDVSHSMNLSDDWAPYGDDPAVVAVLGPEVAGSQARMTRIEVIKRILLRREGEWLKRLSRKGVLRVLAFARKLRQLGEDIPRGSSEGWEGLLASLRDLNARGEGGDETHLANAIQEAVLALRGKRVAAVVVLSDWRQTGGDLTLQELPRELVRPDTGTTIPVMAVGIGSPKWPLDTAIVSLTGPDRVLAGDRAEFVVTISGQGAEPGTPLTVDLLVDGVQIKSYFPNLVGQGRRQQVFVDHRFPAKGRHRLTVRLQPLPREADTSNNEASREVDVIERKIKVLYVEDVPRWDYRYLTWYLMRDPTVEFQGLLLSADSRWRQETSLHPPLPPLRRFPSDRAALFRYDVLIIGDVDPSQAFTEKDMENIRAFAAEGGGGIIFIAGPYYNPWAYAHTPLAEALPVEVGEFSLESPTEREAVREPFRVRLTPEGLEHPIMRLVADKERNRDLWENTDGLEYNSLPGFWWFAPVERLKKGAIALAVHPAKRHPRYGPRVIFATQLYGKGRTFFSAVDSTWRWRAGVGGLYFNRFWGQVIRYVAASRLRGETARYQLAVDKPTYHPGDLVVVNARILDEDLRPVSDPQWTVWLQGPGEEAEKRSVVLRQDDPTQPGLFTGSFEAGAFGTYVVSLPQDPTVRVSFRVVVPTKERQDVRMDEAAAKLVAKATGGSYYTVREVDRLPEDVEVVKQEIVQTTAQHPLWNRWWAILLVGLLAGLEWSLRKLRRLL